jgi:flagellar biosynthesis/type III secretory pathway chaperone
VTHRDPLPSNADWADGVPEPVAKAVAGLLRLLQAEGSALIGGDTDAMARAVREKEAALRRLASLLERADCATLAEVFRRARDLNQRNARLLAPHLNANRARIETLFGAARSGALYSSDGRTATSQNRLAPRGVRA